MELRPRSPAPEGSDVLLNRSRQAYSFIAFDDSKYYDPPLSSVDQRPSPSLGYNPYNQDVTSPRISAPSPQHGSDLGQSPQVSEGTYIKSRTLSPMIPYAEIHSPDPEIVYGDAEKEVVYTKAPAYQTYPTYPVPGIRHQDSGDRPQVWTAIDQNESEDGDAQYVKRPPPRRIPFHKRWILIAIGVAIIVLVTIGVTLGVVLLRKTSAAVIGPTKNNPGVDINTSVGGYINDDYYSKSGAFNGSGIAIAAANTAYNQAIYAFYQDPSGTIQYTLMDPQSRWSLVGPVNSGSHKALNGTPLSTVQHQLGNTLVWHLFYIDEDYVVRERIITNTSTTGPSPIWADGPLNDLNLKAWNSTSIGLQGCYWGNYYGTWSYDTAQASAGIRLWYASDATVFQQYSWTNGTDSWNRDRQWNDLSGNGGVGCQTWDTGMTEYVWFVDTNEQLTMYWQDNNRTALATDKHPIGQWTPVDIGVENVQRDSGLGYTNYMIWQSNDTTIMGANITWGAENTTIAAGNGENGRDTWTLQQGGNDIHALRGTHLSITAVSTVGGGAELLTFFQESGDDMQMYTRDARESGALWQAAAQDPVTPDSS